MKLIGITGGIGAGKSAVTDYLTGNGYVVIDADRVSKALLQPNSPLLLQVQDAFQETILQDDGSLDRKRLGDIVFSDSEKKAILDRLMHERILKTILAQIEALSHKEIVFIDAALLYEANWDLHMDQVWVVDADEETRISRVMNRDPLSREEVMKRMANQMNREERLHRADFILDNSGSKEHLYKQINQLVNKL